MKNYAFLILICLLWSCKNDNLATGNVYGSKKQPLDSVKVIVSGTDIYTFTDQKGHFKINTNGLNDELLFDKTGYQLDFKKIDKKNKPLKVILELREN